MDFRKHAPKPGEAPTGTCECGCGLPVHKLSTYTNAPMRYWHGCPVPYLPGHRSKTTRSDKGVGRPDRTYQPTPDEIPSGICECSCGLPTPITNHTNRRTRHFKGCPSPYLRGHTPGRFKSGPESHKWKGGRWVHKSGYVYVYKPEHPEQNQDGYVLEHRLLCEVRLGRYLLSTEHVHHINGIRADNHLENLVVLTSAEHGRINFESLRDYYASLPAEEAHRLRSEQGLKGAKAKYGLA